MRKGINIGLLLFIFLSLIILLVKIPFLSDISSLIQNLFAVPKKGLYGFSLKVSSPLSLYAENNFESLKKENRDILAKLIDYERLKKDNTVLKQQFEGGHFKAEALISAHVVGYLGRRDLPNALVIDKGTQDGVEKGTGVVLGNNLVGKITDTSKSFSKVLLPDNKEFSVVAKTISGDTSGIIRGEDDFILLDNVVITDTLTKGDVIITKGDIASNGVGVPPDIVIGKIVSVNKTENKPFQNAQIEPILDYSKLDMVFVFKRLD